MSHDPYKEVSEDFVVFTDITKDEWNNFSKLLMQPSKILTITKKEKEILQANRGIPCNERPI